MCVCGGGGGGGGRQFLDNAKVSTVVVHVRRYRNIFFNNRERFINLFVPSKASLPALHVHRRIPANLTESRS